MSFSASPDVTNRTPFAFEPAFLADEEGTPLFVPIVKATYAIAAPGRLELTAQRPVNLAGEFWGDPDTSSYRFEPESAFMKPATDVVLLGHAYPSGAMAAETTVGLRVGQLQKVITVVGDRYWEPGLTGAPRMSTAVPFDRIPLRYERAFGGWDPHDAGQRAGEPRNPVGTGFHTRWDGQQRLRLPNLEDPQHRIRSFGDRPPPAGFGFVAANWQPRAQFAGTYDDAWMAERRPLLPVDFNRRFFNAASAGLVAAGYLAGDEPVTVVNASARGRLDFTLPAVPAPHVAVTLRRAGTQNIPLNLDTVIIDADEDVVVLIWRGHVRIVEVPRDVAAVTVE